MAWAETHSASFTARHGSADAEAASAVLDALERFRVGLDARFERTPGDVAVVIHPHWAQLALAHPWLPLAHLAAAPASRRYFAGWFASGEIHVLAPAALEERASAVSESREALRRAPLHEYAHLVIGANNPALPPPFTPRSFARYMRWAWLCEGAAAHFSGQTGFLRPAIARRLREGPPPSLPPSARDAQLLGGTVFDVLAESDGPVACVELVSRLDPDGPRRAIERAFARPLRDVQFDWRRYLTELAAA